LVPEHPGRSAGLRALQRALRARHRLRVPDRGPGAWLGSRQAHAALPADAGGPGLLRAARAGPRVRHRARPRRSAPLADGPAQRLPAGRAAGHRGLVQPPGALTPRAPGAWLAVLGSRPWPSLTCNGGGLPMETAASPRPSWITQFARFWSYNMDLVHSANQEW